MKIALICEHAAPLTAYKGGTSTADSVHIACLARELAALGHRVSVYSRSSSPHTPDHARMGRGVTVDHLQAGPQRPLTEDEAVDHTGTFARHLATALAADRPDVIHAVNWTSGLAALSASRTAAEAIDTPPIVQTLHSLNSAEQRAGLPRREDRNRMESAIAGRANAVIVNSTDQRLELTRAGRPRAHINVIPYGVDTDHFTPEGSAGGWPWPRNQRSGAGRRRIVSVANLSAGWGAEHLIDIIARVPNTELAIAGGPEAEEFALDPHVRRLELRAKELGVDDRVTLVGNVSRKELPRLLRSAEIYLSAGEYDPYGGAVLEAMSCGLPVVAKASNDTANAVLNGTTGTLLRTSRPEGLARAVRQLAADATSRTAFGIAGSDRAGSRFTWTRVAEETVRVYEQTLTGGSELSATHDSTPD
ncbi:glycosyltransferase [Salinactinospora qingdaonensis]|uniref:Glycosyltransferase family 1 protein n=1 Tax=Salinactinospora qingdaonensis TaxID=702744 RepID=A0ABP7G211_9ACTN